MLRNYIKISIRFLLRNKLFSAINIIGLSIGMAATLLILLWVIDEFSFDLYHTNQKELYRVISKRSISGEKSTNARTPNPLGPNFLENYTDVVNFFRYQGVENWTLKAGEHATFKEVLACADPSIFDMLDFEFILGDNNTAFADPYNMVITQSAANRFFGKTDVVGETIVLFDREVFSISAIIKDIPENSHIMFDCIIPISQFEKYWEQDFESWNSGMFYTYLQLKKSTNTEKLSQAFSKNFSKELAIRNIERVELQKYADIHLNSSDIKQDLDNYNKGNKSQVYLFTLIAIGILLIACINFINLSTAGSINRIKEIGIRKVMGSRKLQLILQFIGESVIISFVAHVIAMFIIEFFISGFNELTNKQLAITYTNPVLITVIVLMILVTGVGAGLFPALYAIRIYKYQVIGKDQSHRKPSRLNFRKILVVTQFVISSTLIICSLFIYKQIYFVNNKDLGYDHENVLRISGYEFKYNFFTKRSVLVQHPGIDNICISHSIYTLGEGADDVQWDGKEQDASIVMFDLGVDCFFTEVYGIDIVEGRGFYHNTWNDTGSFILNETAVKEMNLKDPLGTQVTYQGRKGTVVGVMKDFHQFSLHEPIKPLMLHLDNDVPMVSFKIKEEYKTETIKYIKMKWHELAGEHMPFHYDFADDIIAKSYNNDKKTATFIKYFTVLSIFVAALGLLGLSMLSVKQKTKEIGVRKVNGASTINIVIVMINKYLFLILFGFAFSVPIAIKFVQKWLSNFAYTTEISIWVFAVVLAGLFVLTILTIMISTYRSANENPAESLRYE